ncbi:MAG: hypothetical protein JO218_03600 [Burkholderiales bacterium]|nr:hypothetical protein [Burkholderiales bacterium]
MVTSSTLDTITWLFERAIQDNAKGGDDHCIVARSPERDEVDEAKNRHLIVLNIASYTFRFVALFDFAKDVATREHLARVLRSPEAAQEGQAATDAYAEFVNLICGAVNRELCNVFRHGGMSTPSVLDSQCMRYVATLKPAETLSFDVVINEAMRFRLVVCICVSKGTTLEFQVDRSQVVEEVTGELELF